ncbi:hypothetical protein [Actinokineospora bangkokensis]|uniref:Uncharacterized protein n=1 Tax=Actinokineospora bangkokensis TaxID=1193682 RepID=A0A1Q9LDQ4_9PSEU|nr:hypothetical protein [Actinokineospora bangkokensis]OLR90168.1 hypothetical protein BJP25_04175 [Actinokineospora bangkokensis]
MRARPAPPHPLLTAAAVAALSIVVALVLALLGALGHWSTSEAALTPASATVVRAAGCSSPEPEQVRWTDGAGERTASLDACGHSEGEVVEIAVGTGDVVHLLSANAGSTFDARPVGVVLMVFAGIGGAGLVELWRRTRTAPGVKRTGPGHAGDRPRSRGTTSSHFNV